MNLHDLNEQPRLWGLVHPYDLANVGAIADEMGRTTDAIWLEYARELARQPIIPIPDYQREWLRYYRMGELTVGDPSVLTGPDFDTVEVETRGTRQQNRDALAILRELDWQYARVREWRALPTDMRRVAFTLTRGEWDILRQSLDWYELQRHMGEMQEGAVPTYRGYPLVIW